MKLEHEKLQAENKNLQHELSCQQRAFVTPGVMPGVFTLKESA